jgi:hypothetical protein
MNIQVEAPREGSGPLWVEGEFWLQVRDELGDRIVHVRRPHALLGRLEGADVQIDDRSVSARHVYMHLDSRGLFAVDLSSRTGTRFRTPVAQAAWIGPGQSMEVAGRRVQLIDFRIHQDLAPPGPGRSFADLLSPSDIPLVGVTLHPVPAHHAPRSLESELVFAGRGPTCGVRVEGASSSRVHVAILRTPTGAYVVNLLGRSTWLNERPVLGASRLTDHDVMGLGVARFHVRVRPPAPAGATTLGLLAPHHRPGQDLVPIGDFAGGLPDPSTNGNCHEFDIDTALERGPAPDNLSELVQGLVHADRPGLARQEQREFYLHIIGHLMKMQASQNYALSGVMKEMEAINQELAQLKEEIRRRLSAPRQEANLGRQPGLVPPPARDFLGLNVTPVPMPDTDPCETTNWLLERVSLLERRNQSKWRELLGRLSGGGGQVAN